MNCCVCMVNKASYKCSKCKLPYCCYNCYKIHQGTCTGTKSTQANETQESDNVEVSPFELFRSHKKIIDALGDPRLQRIITRIDSSEDREKELVKELEVNPEFKDFVDYMLSVAPKSIEP